MSDFVRCKSGAGALSLDRRRALTGTSQLTRGGSILRRLRVPRGDIDLNPTASKLAEKIRVIRVPAYPPGRILCEANERVKSPARGGLFWTRGEPGTGAWPTLQSMQPASAEPFQEKI